jgi:ABC-type spermidine/putrescine transport system permease subunit II
MSTDRPHPLLVLTAFAVLAYLVVPSLVVIGMSFGGGIFLEFPPRVLSARWYLAYWSSPAWVDATVRSVKVAVLVTLLATALGTMTSIALTRLALRGKPFLNALVISPVIVPTIVLSIGVYSVYARWRLIRS